MPELNGRRVLFQEFYRDSPWRLLCCTVCLNLCTGRALDAVHVELFTRWPTPYDMTLARMEDLREVLRPLGMQNRRAERLVALSVHYSFLWDGRDPRRLPGIGQYGADSYDIFIRSDRTVRPRDKELRRWLDGIEDGQAYQVHAGEWFLNPRRG